ncbi:conserved hypothetical protein [Psychromonas ingrahamii 37]|uniref:Uncharacterized protein n=1 Tax=Psychromonas ingrahamii (strain DSM 17664 / CCUG 51855 / 37) TaxID=357804 RepID=A1SXM4_PSYIN|nr:hypothetical protein [Psychromonas ingrahamii]ABM04239.1 conserved hypothetical protein [Psychromonas ingrahamii 37]
MTVIKTIEELKSALKDINITSAEFSRQYYLNEVDKDASSSNLEDHYGRFKKLTASSPERIAAYINYFNRTYKKDGTYTQADRNAAWDFFVELDTRIITKALDKESGVDKAALNSLHELFYLHRSIAKKHGPNCKNYYILVSHYFEKHIRPFTSKWHKILKDDNSAIFREELATLQSEMTKLKSQLHKIIE